MPQNNFRSQGEELLKLVRATGPVNEKRALELIRNGAKLDCATSSGDSTIIFACYAGAFSVVEELLARGISANTKGSDKNTALLWACKNGHTKIAELLLKHGADIHAADKSNYDSLRYAVIHKDVVTARLLIDHGADKSLLEEEITKLEKEGHDVTGIKNGFMKANAGAAADASLSSQQSVQRKRLQIKR